MAKFKNQQTIGTTLTALDMLPDRSQDDGLRTLRARQDALRSRLVDSERRMDSIQQSLAASSKALNLERLTAALIEDPNAHIGISDTLRSELNELSQVCDGLRRAIEHGDQETMHREAELDGEACRIVATLHRQNVRATINVMLALHRSIRQQQDLRAELNKRGVHRTSSLIPFAHENFETGADDIHSWLAGQLRELVGAQVLSEDERIALQRGEIIELDVDGVA